ncbi:MAG TPA: hypothetical protein VE476_01085 [Propionibacteriaceae bacterium]|nr:hypothetical protein [Propionibacteriaceae bacterium]
MTDFSDEFGPYLDKALKDPEFRQPYEHAQKEEEDVTEEWTPPTVGDLVAALSKVDQSLPVVLAQDEEGNGFNTWSGDVVESLYDTQEREIHLTPEQWAAEMAKPDSRFDPEDDEPPEIGGDIERVIVVWP